MKGQVLGFDGSSGAINAEDGSRYTFSASDWKGEAPPKSRDSVDFIPVERTATEIYVTRASFFGGGPARPTTPGAPIPESSAVDLRAALAVRPQVIIEAVLLLSCFLLNFMSMSSGFGTHGVALFGVGPAMSRLQSGMTDAARITASITGSAGSPPASLTVLTILGYLLWVVPIGAGYLLFREYRNQRSHHLELMLGVAAVVSLIYILVTKSLLADTYRVMGIPFSDAMAGFIDFGLGAILILLCGIGLFVTATGKLDRTPGL